MKIFYTHNAIFDLKRLREFIVKDNPPVANQVAIKIRQAIARLEDFPLLGRELKEKQTGSALRELITSDYLIRYVILKNEIHILRVWHGKEDSV
jgi:addiction module RelE/StbE family toxin